MFEYNNDSQDSRQEIDTKQELVKTARLLKQKDQLKIYNIIITSYEKGENVEEKLKSALEWSSQLCDLNE